MPIPVGPFSAATFIVILSVEEASSLEGVELREETSEEGAWEEEFPWLPQEARLQIVKIAAKKREKICFVFFIEAKILS